MSFVDGVDEEGGYRSPDPDELGTVKDLLGLAAPATCTAHGAFVSRYLLCRVSLEESRHIWIREGCDNLRVRLEYGRDSTGYWGSSREITAIDDAEKYSLERGDWSIKLSSMASFPGYRICISVLGRSGSHLRLFSALRRSGI